MPRSVTTAMRTALLASALLLPASAQGQEPVPGPVPLLEEPIAPFVFDARGLLARFKGNSLIAETLDVAVDELPTRGLGLVVGAHVYPVRTGKFALGLGGEIVLRARGSSTLPPPVTVPPAVGEETDGPRIVTRMTALSPQVSLNFGKRDGWSYLSGGIGRASLTTELEDSPLDAPESRPLTINYGGGARWFTKKHLAFSLDLRFYAIRAQDETLTRPAFPRMTVMVFSAGISLR